MQKKLVAFKKGAPSSLSPDYIFCIKDFSILNKLGEGSFSRVYLARHSPSSKLYALKLIDLSKGSKNTREIVTREQSAWKPIVHPNIATFHQALICIKDTSILACLILEHAQGVSLGDLLISRDSFSENATRIFISQFVLALRFMHSLSVVHFDIKPGNAVVEKNGHISLIDFGLARIVCAGSTISTSHGTPGYIPPEILISEKANKFADFWSLGVTAYELMSGVSPFWDRDPEKMKKLSAGAIPKYDLRESRYGECSREFWALVSGLLCKDLAHREAFVLNLESQDFFSSHTSLGKFDWHSPSSFNLELDGAEFSVLPPEETEKAVLQGYESSLV